MAPLILLNRNKNPIAVGCVIKLTTLASDYALRARAAHAGRGMYLFPVITGRFLWKFAFVILEDQCIITMEEAFAVSCVVHSLRQATEGILCKIGTWRPGEAVRAPVSPLPG